MIFWCQGDQEGVSNGSDECVFATGTPEKIKTRHEPDLPSGIGQERYIDMYDTTCRWKISLCL